MSTVQEATTTDGPTKHLTHKRPLRIAGAAIYALAKNYLPTPPLNQILATCLLQSEVVNSAGLKVHNISRPHKENKVSENESCI